MKHILIVEDHDNLGHGLKESLIRENFQVTLVTNLQQAESVLSDSFDLIILDWMLPDGQGPDFLSQIRKKEVNTPVIFLTARVELIDKVLGLELGANDYMTKPFEFRELLARIKVQLRNNSKSNIQSQLLDEPQASNICVGSLSINQIKHIVIFQNKKIDLVKKEFDLLVLFAENPEKVFSRDEILNKVWGYDVYPTTRTVDTHVLQLRQKINENLIETVRSVGYRLKVLD